jgi:hypothetical protein
VKIVAELAGYAERRGVTGSRGTADFNKAGGGLLRDAEGEARGPAHEDVGGMAVDQDGGRAEGQRAEMRAEELDFALRQGGGGHDVVDAGIGEDFGGGLWACARHGRA